MIVRKRVYARAGLVGNPSDGYHGKTIAFTMDDFWAEVTLYESPRVEFRPAPQDNALFDSLDDLVDSVQRTGYYGGIRLLKAATKKFAEYCADKGIELDDRNFTMQYQTNIPRQVGLGGSSAIITAAMRALMGFYGVDIQEHILPNVVLAAETEELGLTAGLQDRVVQAYNGLVYMDFDDEYMSQHGHGFYERLDAECLPPLYVAYRTDLSQESSDAHIHVREKYELGDENVVNTMEEIAALADEAKEVLGEGKSDSLPEILDKNFDLRRRIYPISEENLRMVEKARAAGASCKFCGSGGAVVGTYDGESCLEQLRREMKEGNYRLVRPTVVNGR
ncbi:MAG: mevalonate kinase [Planctomycetota bacterium]